jgi:exonuclease III
MILGGSEVGGGNKAGRQIYADAAAQHGYEFFFEGSGDCWIAVKKSFMAGKGSAEWTKVIDTKEGAGTHTDRGLLTVSFPTKDIGPVHVIAAHYLTKGRAAGQPNYVLNRRLAAAIGDRAREVGKGENKVFYMGDQNIVDRTEDTFFGHPFTSAWDEVNRYENTGHGNIDVIASWDPDGAVEALGIRALDDTERHLFTDHFLIEAEYKIRHLKEKKA